MRRDNGFTLIELMVALAVVAILTVIAFPSYQRYIQRGIRAQGQVFLMDLSTPGTVLPGSAGLCNGPRRRSRSTCEHDRTRRGRQTLHLATAVYGQQRGRRATDLYTDADAQRRRHDGDCE